MKYDEAITYLDRHIELGWKPGLDRIVRLLEMMGGPQGHYPVIHIAGTNGKTTVTRAAASIVNALGLKAGAYTSPHLQHVRERFALAGDEATEEQFAQAVDDVAPFVDLLEMEIGERATYFELTTAAAFAFFSGMAADVGVIEVGMGGRLDATNVVDAQVAVLTGVSIDHAEYLGHTPVAIAREKLAIVKPGGVLITGELSDEVASEADRTVEQLGTVRRTLGRDFHIERQRMSVGGWTIDVDGIHERYEDLHVPLHGRHQASNATVAVAAVEELLGRAIPIEAVREGLATLRTPARTEVVGHSPLIVIDGAHNPEGCEALVRTLLEEFRPMLWTLVVGAFRDKDLPSMLRPLVGFAARVITTCVDHPRAALPDDIVRLVDHYRPDIPVSSTSDVATALELARAWTGPEEAIVVAGSLYVAGEARAAILG